MCPYIRAHFLYVLIKLAYIVTLLNGRKIADSKEVGGGFPYLTERAIASSDSIEMRPEFCNA